MISRYIEDIEFQSISATGKILYSFLRLELRKIAGQLQADADIVLHSPDLPGKCHSVSLECGCAYLELIRVYLHLLP